MHLTAPWSAEAAAPAYRRHRQARATWQKINEDMGGVWRDPSLKAFDAKSSAARKRGAMAEAARINKARMERMHELQDGVIARLREGKGFGRPLEETGLYPKLAVQMILVGEESGRLEEITLLLAVKCLISPQRFPQALQ